MCIIGFIIFMIIFGYYIKFEKFFFNENIDEVVWNSIDDIYIILYE